jgi:hypothetical protein
VASGLTVDIVADPGEGIVKPIATEVTKTILEDVTEKGIDSIGTGDGPAAPHYSQWQTGWEQGARDDFNNSDSQNLTGNSGRVSLVNSAKGQPFVVNGKILDPAQMNAKQLNAYNSWLSTPAVGDYVLGAGGVGALQLGYRTSFTQENIGGG